MLERVNAILSSHTIMLQEIAESLVAVPAFLPALLCPGYLAGWFTNLHQFRKRSLIERIFWSLPLSLAVTTITSVLIGKYLSLNYMVGLLILGAVAWMILLGREWNHARQTGCRFNFGWCPLGRSALALACAWVALAVLTLVDLQGGHKLFMSLTMFDHGMRIAWTEAVLHTGIPPSNPLYFFHQPTNMRYYYFWYVVCASVARLSNLPSRAIFVAGCVWAGFALTGLVGLYLKHYLLVRTALRKYLIRSLWLLMITGVGICVNLWNYFYSHVPLPGYLEVWKTGQIASWFDTLLWNPHHLASMICCMLAFLLAWIHKGKWDGSWFASCFLIACALASAFGLSIYVAFAFFLVIFAWAPWQVFIEKNWHPVLMMLVGGLGAVVLLIPYLRELTHTTSKMHGPALFEFAIRETIPPARLLATHLFRSLSASHPVSALNLANLILLIPGYAVELGLFFGIFLIYAIPAWHGHLKLDSARRSLIYISSATFVIISTIRSGVLDTNDFGWRAALLLQFPLLLLAVEATAAWDAANQNRIISSRQLNLGRLNPYWLRSAASFALLLGGLTTLYQALMVRFTLPLFENSAHVDDPTLRVLSHKAYISYLGYHQMDRSIPTESIVQYNPASSNPFWGDVDWLGTDRQTALAFDHPGCGSEFGGDPSGCAPMAAAIDAVFKGASAEQARSTCHEYGIQYLVARIYDPVWNSRQSWVWSLPAVVSDPEFRVLNCQ